MELEHGMQVGKVSELRRVRLFAVAALGVAFFSLGLNLFMLSKVREAERMIAPVLPYLGSIGSEDGVLRSQVVIPSGTPINLDIPVNERFTVTVDTILPINTRITVPLRSALGNYDIPLPIRANVPIRAVLPIQVQHVFELRSSTSRDITVPVELGGEQ